MLRCKYLVLSLHKANFVNSPSSPHSSSIFVFTPKVYKLSPFYYHLYHMISIFTLTPPLNSKE